MKYELLESVPASRAAKKYNPSGKVPILLEWEKQSYEASLSGNETAVPSFVLTESIAINNYLAEICNSSLVPASGRERAKYDAAIAFIMSEIDGQTLWTYRKHVQLGKHFGYVPEIEKPVKDHFDRMNRLVSDQLKESEGEYLLGEKFSAVDILYVHCLVWGRMYGWDDGYQKHVVDYVQLCESRSAYLEANRIRRSLSSATKGETKTGKRRGELLEGQCRTSSSKL
mmetsp:Transcript_6997/g.14338  ORF Transcript_6997/g.14338 Transcript_6997/m.14338 type:complete len:227 (+) Transcript_6997:3-683(+)